MNVYFFHIYKYKCFEQLKWSKFLAFQLETKTNLVPTLVKALPVNQGGQGQLDSFSHTMGEGEPDLAAVVNFSLE